MRVTALLLPPGRRGRLVLAACALVFLAERAAEAAGAAPSWASSRVDDLVCLPLVLAAAAAVHRLAGRGPGWRLPPRHGLAVVVLYAVVFEVVLPRAGSGAVADPLDAAAYLAGWLLYAFVIDP